MDSGVMRPDEWAWFDRVIVEDERERRRMHSAGWLAGLARADAYTAAWQQRKTTDSSSRTV